MDWPGLQSTAFSSGKLTSTGAGEHQPLTPRLEQQREHPGIGLHTAINDRHVRPLLRKREIGERNRSGGRCHLEMHAGIIHPIQRPGIVDKSLVEEDKLGLANVAPELIGDLLQLMVASKADYRIVFRDLASLPTEVTPLKRGFYVPSDAQLEAQWNAWLTRWHKQLSGSGKLEEIAASMHRTNPAITWREWRIAPAYE